MKYYCNPLNLEYCFQMEKISGQDSDRRCRVFREAADPSLIKFKGIYWLFLSMTGGFYTSEDLLEWKYYAFGENMPLYDYAPDVQVIGDAIWLCAYDHSGSFYFSHDPRKEPFQKIQGDIPLMDPNLFLDDDERVFLYWGCSDKTPLWGTELEPSSMQPITEPKALIYASDIKNGYERKYENHEKGEGEEYPPYIEGAWMTKYRDCYYLQYAVPGTALNVYGDGVYTSSNPLGPFTLAKNNPFSYKPGGFITGAGHGSTLLEQDGYGWHISTMRISHTHKFERRIGLWRAGIDEDGELYCDQRYGDWPVRMNAGAWEKPDWMLLSYGKKVEVSSGTGAQNVTDEDIRTWWRAEGSQDEWLQIDLGAIKDVRAIQINFAEDGICMEAPEGAVFEGSRFMDRKKQPLRWMLEGSKDGERYIILKDKTSVNSDYPHDFLVWEAGCNVRYLRLTINSLPYNQKVCISGVRVFGKGHGKLPEPVRNIKINRIDGLSMDVSWIGENAIGYNILWGAASDKLYHSYMVFGHCQQHIGALIKDMPVYVRVDAFNEVGITEGQVSQEV